MPQALRYEHHAYFAKTMTMNDLDPLVKSLAELCAREGGHEFVAEKAKVSADNLWQILKGIKLPSGKPRGVGARLRERLSNTYPDWLTHKVEQKQASYLVAEHIKPFINPVDESSAPSVLAKALGQLFDALPQNNVMRASVFWEVSNLIQEAGRKASKSVPSALPDPAPSPEKQSEPRQISPASARTEPTNPTDLRGK